MLALDLRFPRLLLHVLVWHLLEVEYFAGFISRLELAGLWEQTFDRYVLLRGHGAVTLQRVLHISVFVYVHHGHSVERWPL